MDTLQNLLNRINQILILERTMEEERRKRGENFNIFSVLNLSRNETRLHSAFIAELLDPDGSHGLKDAFLRCFINYVVPKEFDFVTDGVTVETEFNIGPKNEEETYGGRIDLLLTNRRNQALIVENKIDALEQGKQLERYCNYAKNSFSDYKILYLTLEGSESKTIPEEEKTHYKPISYRTHILNWLESCIGIAVRHPLIRETIQQYIINLKEILNIMNEENKNSLIDIASSKEYVDPTLAIIENGEDIKKKIRQNFLDELRYMAERKGFEVCITENMCAYSVDGACIQLTQPVSNIWAIWIGWDDKGKHVLHGIGNIYEVKNQAKKEVFAKLPHVWEKGSQSTWYPCGWTYLWGEDGRNGCWWNWKDTQTLKDMANGKMLHFIETEIIDKVLNERLLEKVQDAIPEY